MNAAMENILTRRSVRAFEEKEIPREELEQIAKAAIYAPSGQNKQTWKITVVTDRDKIQTLAKAVGKALGREGYDMYSPQVLVIPMTEITIILRMTMPALWKILCWRLIPLELVLYGSIRYGMSVIHRRYGAFWESGRYRTAM